MMNVFERNRQVFLENRELAVTKYKALTEKLLYGTRVFTEPLRCAKPDKLGASEVSFDKNDTVSSSLDAVRRGYKTCALNFADAYTPGGLVFEGEVTQEEDICRCSNLYESLVKPECLADYYEFNKKLNTSAFSDRVIYSKNVALIRESTNYTLLDEPVLCDVITCPAPIGGRSDYETVMEQRIRAILSVAAEMGSDTLILGAYGCGAFGGDANVVGRLFAKVLCEFKCFDRIVFSVKGANGSNYERLLTGYRSYNT